MENTNKVKQLKKQLSNDGIEFVEFKTIDLMGKTHSLVLPINMLNEDLMMFGVGFDASSYGFSKPENSDMVLIPDLDTVFIDPFRNKKTAVMFSNIHLTDKMRSRFYQDVRYIAQKAENVLLDSKIGTQALFSPEFEFFIFKKAEFSWGDNYYHVFLEKEFQEKRNFYHLDSTEDVYVDFKNELVSILQSIGVDIKYHHHEVSVNQHEIETGFTGLLKTADMSIKIKYCVFNLAKKYNLFVTFMPKPFYEKAGNGWHVHHYVLNETKNIFYDEGKYANFSSLGLSYLSGILFHSSSLCAISNPSTNSYKRLVKGFEAPVAVTFGQSNRNGAIRIPAYVKEKETRFEYRSSDAMVNPYLFLSAMMMAGIDGVLKNIDPEKFHFGPFDHLNPESKLAKTKIKMLPRSLNEALMALEKDNEYLKFKGVFDENIINQWIKIKSQEIYEIEMIPHPAEFLKYFYF